MSALVSVDPATGRELARYATMAGPETEALLEKAASAQAAWASRPVSERADLVSALASALGARAAEGAELAAREMGKPRREGVAEIEKCAWACSHYAERGPGMLVDEPVATDALRSYIAHEPLGVVLAVMPWNFPFWQVLRFAAPNLVAGNAVVVKHAPNVTGCALAIERWVREAGLPEGLLTVALVEVERVGALVADPRIAAVTLTGSPRAGRAVAAVAGAHLKPAVLELGGSDPYVVLEDADLDQAAEACVTARLINTGQSCIAGKRWIVVDAVRAAFTERCVAAMDGRVVGPPLDGASDLGPLAREDLRARLHRQVTASVDLGARRLTGGTVPTGPGFFYPATVLADVAPGMPAFDQETFGPVGAVVPARDEQEALALANRTSYGLGAAVFTADRERGERLARRWLKAGNAFVNTFVRSDPRLPFGGVRASGYGRELGLPGIRAFVNEKTVFVGGGT